MKIRLKNIFKKSRTSTTSNKAATTATTTPVKSGPRTPSTEPVREGQLASAASSGDGRDYGFQEEGLPVKNLLDDLNVYASKSHITGETELVLGGSLPLAPDDEPPMEESPMEQAPMEEEFPMEEPSIGEEDVTPKSSNFEQKRSNIPALTETVTDEISVDSPLRPRQLDPPATLDGIEEADPNQGGYYMSRVMGLLERATECVMTSESIQKIIPTAENSLCHTIGRVKSVDNSERHRKLIRQYSYFNENFALKILEELVNVGYALVYHRQVSAGEDSDDSRNWVGRSVTLILRPGTCNSLLIQAPYLEWATLGGGQQTDIETTSVSLLDIHSIATSTAEDMNLDDDDPNPEQKDDDYEAEQEDLQCFFSLTTKEGNVYVMEAITADESQRLVVGVKNLVSRLAKQIVAGDKSVLSDFFDNVNDADDIRLSTQEAMNRLSHLLLDHLA